MNRKSLILAIFGLTLAAGSAFAADHVSGKVARIDAANGDIWLNTGVKFPVGTALASSLLPGNSVSIVFTDYNRNIDVLAVSPAS